MSSEASSNLSTPKTAVLTYGLVRHYEKTFSSLEKMVLAPNNADLFFFGPNYTDRPNKDFAVGKQDQDGFFIRNPKSKKSSFKQVNKDKFFNLTSPYLVQGDFHNIPYSAFKKECDSFLKKSDWLFDLDPARILSMSFNLGGVIDNFISYCTENNVKYDRIILTRLDISFYSKISAQVSDHDIHIPSGEGFDEIGRHRKGNAAALYYKNINTSEFVPGGRSESFNDQIMFLSHQNILKLSSLYKVVLACLKRKVPPSPETIFYLIFKNIGLNIVEHPEWIYEIYRAGNKDVTSVIDTPDLKNIDRYHATLTGGGDFIQEANFLMSQDSKDNFPHMPNIDLDRPYMPNMKKNNRNKPKDDKEVLYYHNSPAYLRLFLKILSLFMSDQMENKMKYRTDLFFRDAKNPITKIVKPLYLFESFKKTL